MRLAYKLNNQTIKLIKQMKENNKLENNITKLFFEYKNGIFYIKSNTIYIRKRLIIPKSIKLKVYEYVYNQLGYPGYKQTHEKLLANFYIFNITKNLYVYLYYYH